MSRALNEVHVSEGRALRAEKQIGLMSAFFPILPRLGNEWAKGRPWQGLTLGMNLHLTTLTGALVRELELGGAQCVLSAANPATTDAATVELLRGVGARVYTGGDMHDRHQQVLAHDPQLLVDVGLELVATLLDRAPQRIPGVRAAVEITRSGVVALRGRPAPPPFPVVNIDDGRLKQAIENRHGVGEGVWQAVCTLTGMHLSGRRALIVGYGSVGPGLASYARASGASVEVVELDPVRRLCAHYDGFPTPSLAHGLRRADIAITATGCRRVVTADHLRHARDGIVLANAGHGGDEVDVEGIERACRSRDHISTLVARYHLDSGRSVTLLGSGHPLNIVLNAGSPEPFLLHFAVLGLTLEWLARSTPGTSGEIQVPNAIEERAAAVALEALTPTSG